MRIALVHYRLTSFGGLETRMMNYMQWFVNQGHEVHLICSYIKNDLFELPPNVQVHELNLGIMPKLFRGWYFYKKVLEFYSKQTFDFSLAMGRTAGSTAVLAPGNHLGFLRAMPKKWLSISDRLQIFLDHKAHDNNQTIFAASQFMRDELIELYGVNSQKIKVLYPPLNLQKLNSFSGGPKINRSTSSYHFAFISTSHQRKGLPLLLSVFARLNPEKFVLHVCGLPKVITKLPNVINHGFLRNTAELLQEVDALVHPAVYEPFGQVVSEALACGKPVLLSNRVGAKELITPELGEVLHYNSVESWVDCFERFHPNNYNIPENWAEKAEITTEHHLQKMMRYCQDAGLL